jgi:cbb3-type cytochrome oxidase maturation protein
MAFAAELAGAVFWWTLGTGQFDDLEGPGKLILMEEKPRARPMCPNLLI